MATRINRDRVKRQLEKKTLAELRHLTQKLNVPGRSKLGNTSELIQALLGHDLESLWLVLNPQRPPTKPFWKRAAFWGVSLTAFSLVATIVGLLHSPLPNPPARRATSLAVLPFTYDSESTQWLAEGLANAVSASLAQLNGLAVLPRSAAADNLGHGHSAVDRGRRLSVAFVVEGHVSARDESTQVHIDLLDVENKRVVWREDYKTTSAELVNLQGYVATGIARIVGVEMLENTLAKLSNTGTRNPVAYRDFVIAREQWGKRTTAGLRNAEKYYTEALAEDPQFSRAHAGLAETYVLFPLFHVTKAEASMPLVRQHADAALEGDDDIAKAHAYVALGAYWSNYAWNQLKAETVFRLAIGIAPNYETAHHWLGNMSLQAMGKFDEAIAEGRRAEHLDWISPIIAADTAQNLLFARRYPEAIDKFRDVLEKEPTFYYAMYYLGLALHANGQCNEAIEMYEKALDLEKSPYVMGLLARSLASVGQADRAEDLFGTLEEMAEHVYVPGVALALASDAIGKREDAFRYLERDIEERTYYPAYYAVDPTYDDLRSDPRFELLIERVSAMKIE